MKATKRKEEQIKMLEETIENLNLQINFWKEIENISLHSSDKEKYVSSKRKQEKLAETRNRFCKKLLNLR